MNRMPLVLAAMIGAYVVHSTPAQAQASRTFVSGHGTDSGSCAVTAPCRSFAYAVTQTAASGEITVLDSAGYGPVQIAQSLTITNPGGVEAGITAASGSTAIFIDAPSSTAINVTLRGLTLEGGNASGTQGINLVPTLSSTTSTSTLNVIGCVIKDFTGDAIAAQPNGSGYQTLNVSDSVLVNNTGGLLFMPSNGSAVYASVYGSIINSNRIGIEANASSGTIANVTVTNSHLDHNTSSAITLGANTGLQLIASTALYNGNLETGDITNSGTLEIAQNNVVGAIENSSIAELFEGNTVTLFNNVGSGSGFTDGTNHITALGGNPLIKQSPQ